MVDGVTSHTVTASLTITDSSSEGWGVAPPNDLQTIPVIFILPSQRCIGRCGDMQVKPRPRGGARTRKT